MTPVSPIAMRKASRKDLGARGEDLATRFLERAGYTILERNYRWARGEIDIIAERDGLLVFVEVKTARSAVFGRPETWVNAQKQQQLGQVASRYLQEKEIEEMDCRFDVIAIRRQEDGWEIRHIENAFWL